MLKRQRLQMEPLFLQSIADNSTTCGQRSSVELANIQSDVLDGNTILLFENLS